MKKILIVNADYYKIISGNLVFGAKNILKKNKTSIKIINVPGVFEIPIMIKKNIKKFDGFLALGCVIKGETPHFELICKSTFDAIMNLTVVHQKPIGNGIITCLNMSQAIKRSSKKNSSLKPNKGVEAANAVISILSYESQSK